MKVIHFTGWICAIVAAFFLGKLFGQGEEYRWRELAFENFKTFNSIYRDSEYHRNRADRATERLRKIDKDYVYHLNKPTWNEATVSWLFLQCNTHDVAFTNADKISAHFAQFHHEFLKPKQN